MDSLHEDFGNLANIKDYNAKEDEEKEVEIKIKNILQSNVNFSKNMYKCIFETKNNLFITGSGGTGKSVLIKSIKDICDLKGIQCALTSTTGVTALNIAGETIHRFAGLKIGRDPASKIVYNLKKYPDKYDRLKELDILIIDEVSMFSSHLFELLEEVLRKLRCGMRVEGTPKFGGVQIIFVGDFLQLSPIESSFCFESPLWKNMHFKNFKLKYPFRFIDKDFFNLLTRIRIGKQTPKDIKLLESRVDAYKTYLKNKDQHLIKPTVLHSIRKDVKIENLCELDKLNELEYKYKANDLYYKKSRFNQNVDEVDFVLCDYVSAGEKEFYQSLLNGVIEEELIFKKGAQVILLKNLSENLCNGSKGIIDECFEDRISVIFINVNDVNGYKKMIKFVEFEFEDDKYIVSRLQIPLTLAYASTVHRSQGMSLDSAIVSLDTVFTASQAYVALSRVRSLKGLYLTGVNPKKIYPNPEGLEFENSLIFEGDNVINEKSECPICKDENESKELTCCGQKICIECFNHESVNVCPFCRTILIKK